MTTYPTTSLVNAASSRQALAERWANTVHSAIHANHLNPDDYDILPPTNGGTTVLVYCDLIGSAYGLANVLAGSSPWGISVSYDGGVQHHTIVCVATPVVIKCDLRPAPPSTARGGGHAGALQPVPTTPSHLLQTLQPLCGVR